MRISVDQAIRIATRECNRERLLEALGPDFNSQDYWNGLEKRSIERFCAEIKEEFPFIANFQHGSFATDELEFNSSWPSVYDSRIPCGRVIKLSTFNFLGYDKRLVQWKVTAHKWMLHCITAKPDGAMTYSNDCLEFKSFCQSDFDDYEYFTGKPWDHVCWSILKEKFWDHGEIGPIDEEELYELVGKKIP